MSILREKTAIVVSVLEIAFYEQILYRAAILLIRQVIDELGFEWLGGGTQYIRVSKSSKIRVKFVRY